MHGDDDHAVPVQHAGRRHEAMQIRALGSSAAAVSELVQRCEPKTHKATRLYHGGKAKRAGRPGFTINTGQLGMCTSQFQTFRHTRRTRAEKHQYSAHSALVAEL
ncbi:unnamed protein product [Urochloa humidicola]